MGMAFSPTSQVGHSVKTTKSEGDISVTASTWATAPILLSAVITLIRPAKIMVAFQGQASPPVGFALHATAELDGANVSGNQGLVKLDADIRDSINFSYLSEELAAGSHQVDVRAMVTGGTGTIYANAATSTPISLTLVVVT